MITWVLATDPDEHIAKAIEIVEARLGTEEEVMWLSPVIEPDVTL